MQRGKDMSYYVICPLCGAYLDPGEKCDCQEHEEAEASRIAVQPSDAVSVTADNKKAGGHINGSGKQGSGRTGQTRSA